MKQLNKGLFFQNKPKINGVFLQLHNPGQIKSNLCYACDRRINESSCKVTQQEDLANDLERKEFCNAYNSKTNLFQNIAAACIKLIIQITFKSFKTS